MDRCVYIRSIGSIMMKIILLSASLYAQPSDTVFHTDKDTRYKYSIVTRDDKGRLHGTVNSYGRHGQLMRSAEYAKGILHGTDTYYYKNGQVSMIAPYVNGKIHGISHLYHPNGNVEWIKGYKNGKLDGERIARDSSGTLLDGEHEFQIAPNSNVTMKVFCINGRPHGAFSANHPNGKVSFTGRYENGLPEGDYVYYNWNGQVDHVDEYRNGKFIRTRKR
jgi:antitoxin component YwqK of YwqJK toxin-antitoxin module